ncbi:conjugal transfer protein, partial [Vibrio sp. 10N.261.45.F1]
GESSSQTVIRSNVYLTRTVVKGGRKQPPEKLVLNLQWTLSSKKELVKQSMESLRLNPIGLTILSYQLNKERS